MRKIIYMSLILCVLPLSFADAYTFTRSLSQGSVGDDVMELQKYLNNDPATQIATTGPGSPGSETRYFGSMTKEAVIKLQNINADIILKPYGLTQGTGYVGKSTRDFLNRFETAFSNTQSAAIVTDTDRLTDQAISTIGQYSTTTKQLSTDIEKIILQLEKEAKKGNTQSASSTSTTDKIIEEWSKKYAQGGTGTDIEVTNDSFVVSPQNVKKDHHFYVGSQKDISGLTFFIGDRAIGSKCFTKYTCRLRVPSGFDLGKTTISTNNPKFGSQNIEVIAQSEERPELFVTKLSLSNENVIKGKHFGANMTIRTPYGTYTTSTRNNSFTLEFPKGNTYVPGPGYLFAQNESGLQSDILTLQYEK